MKSFADSDRSASGIVLHDAEEHPFADQCAAGVLDAVKSWSDRPDKCAPNAEVFHLPRTVGFTISWDGKSRDHWPDEAGAVVSESLVREFLFHDGICTVKDDEVRYHRVSYRMVMEDDVEHLLTCPFPTPSGNIGGLVVVCVNHHLR